MEKMLGSANHHIHSIRTNPSWRHIESVTSASKLSHEFNVVTLSIPFLLREAARSNPFNTTGFIWIGLRDPCISQSLTSSNTRFIKANMNNLLTPVTPHPISKSILGIPKRAVEFYTGNTKAETVNVVGVSGLGGRGEHVEVFAFLYEIVLRSALLDGLLGSVEAYLTIVAQRYPNITNPINNQAACEDSRLANLSCSNGKSCILFSHSMNG
eukprot:c15967_g1_i2.p1 GENE.c15967_g1_i2~~c15967_g1_i2.p1  ORF type:complete len:212 (+),score=27.72 c15967_g1_i2:472-1107(+)